MKKLAWMIVEKVIFMLVGGAVGSGEAGESRISRVIRAAFNTGQAMRAFIRPTPVIIPANDISKWGCRCGAVGESMDGFVEHLNNCRACDGRSSRSQSASPSPTIPKVG